MITYIVPIHQLLRWKQVWSFNEFLTYIPDRPHRIHHGSLWYVYLLSNTFSNQKCQEDFDTEFLCGPADGFFWENAARFWGTTECLRNLDGNKVISANILLLSGVWPSILHLSDIQTKKHSRSSSGKLKTCRDTSLRSTQICNGPELFEKIMPLCKSEMF